MAGKKPLGFFRAVSSVYLPHQRDQRANESREMKESQTDIC